MIKTTRIYFALVGILMLFAGCKKEDEWGPCNNTPYYSSLDPALAAFVFGDSSQWIYHRTIDSIADTVTLTFAQRTVYSWQSVGGTAHMTGGCPTVYLEEEQFYLHYNSSLTGPYTDFLARDQIFRAGNPRGTIYMIGAAGASYQDFFIESIHDTLTIANHRFENVMQVITAVEFPGEWGQLRLYHAPGLGIVRKEIRRSDSIYDAYDLVDWQIRRR